MTEEVMDDYCEYCFAEEDLTCDHVVPRSWADDREIWNLIIPSSWQDAVGEEQNSSKAELARKARLLALAAYGWSSFIYSEENKVSACRSCNSSKGDRLPDDEWLLELVSEELGFDIRETGFAERRGLWPLPDLSDEA